LIPAIDLLHRNKTKKMKIVIGKNSSSPLEVNRMGFGTMRLTGPEIWGEPADRPQALQILKTAVLRGVNFIDTADYYGRDVTNRLIKEALFPYPKGLVICTKVGGNRREDKSWFPYASPQNLRDSVDNNLRTLQLEQLSLVHLRMISHSDVPFVESLEAMFELQKEGKILHVGLSNVGPEDVTLGMSKGAIATVENAFGYALRKTFSGPAGLTMGGEDVLPICEKNEIPLIPFFSLLTFLPSGNKKITEIAKKYGATEAQINLAWLFAKSPFILPIPGTSKLKHLEENLKSDSIQLSKDDMDYLG
jgi:pyridoxine 4-dehydrogenase